MNEAIFGKVDGRYVPSVHARGPWDPGAQHGGAPAALLTGAFERLAASTGLTIARLDFQFVRPVPMVPLELHAEVEQPGRRVQRLYGTLSAERTVVVARALCVAPVAASALGWAAEEPALPAVDGARDIGYLPSGDPSFGASGVEIRALEGGFEPGPSEVWVRLRRPVVAGEPPTPLMCTAATADFGNGIGSVLPWDRYVFINADLSLALWRPPGGEWIGLRARTQLGAGGAALSESTLYDDRGAFGRGQQSLLVAERGE